MANRGFENVDNSEEEYSDDESTALTYGKKRASLHYQMGYKANNRGSGAHNGRRSVFASNFNEDDDEESYDDISVAISEFQEELNTPFESKFNSEDMRCLALVAHNHMKPAMKAFIETHSEILKKFRLVGTNTTITMCKAVFGEDNPDVEYGPQCTSGPLGGDAQLCALMCLEDVGGVIFFIDPLSAHPHQADIDSLIRLCNVHNVLFCTNPTSGISTMHLLRHALVGGKAEMMASFFQTLESPSVPEYKAAQKAALANAIAR